MKTGIVERLRVRRAVTPCEDESSAITGRITSSINAVDAMMRLRSCTATSPEGSITTILHPASAPQLMSMVAARSAHSKRGDLRARGERSCS